MALPIGSCERVKDANGTPSPHSFVMRYSSTGRYLFDICSGCGIKIPKDLGPGGDTNPCEKYKRQHLFEPRFDRDVYLFDICVSCGRKILEDDIQKKPRIAIGVDNTGWCWTRAMESVAHCLPQYDFDIIPAREFKKIKDFSAYTAVFLRGYANAFITSANRGVRPVFVSTLSTGGNNLTMRMEEMESIAQTGHGIVVQNKNAFHQCRKASYHPVWIIPNGVNTDVYFPTTKPIKETIVGCAANTRDERAMLKGTPFVIKACKKLKVKYIEANHENPLTYEEMADWYRKLTIYAQPSDSEGCSNSVTEAMASGLPCLIVDGVGYHGEVCKCATEHEDGEVIFVKRTEEDIAEKIQLLIDDKELYERVSRNALTFAQNHSWKMMSVKYKEVFDYLCDVDRQNRAIANFADTDESTEEKEQHLKILQIMDVNRKKLKIQNTTDGVIEVIDLFNKIKELKESENDNNPK